MIVTKKLNVTNSAPGPYPPDQPDLPDAAGDHLLLLRLHAARRDAAERHCVRRFRNEDLGNGKLPVGPT